MTEEIINEHELKRFPKRIFSDEWRRKLSEAGKGKKKSEEWKRKMSERVRGKGNPMYGRRPPDKAIQVLINSNKNRIGEKHHMWKGDGISIDSLHERIRRRFPKSEHPICMLCLKRPSEQLACITGIYNMDLKNWAWFCISCHLKWDNIGRNFFKKNKKLN